MRFAIYYAPPLSDPLHEVASRWLGRDAITGQSHSLAANMAFSAEDMARLTADPRRYGFHATLKAPFDLADGTDRDMLIEAFHQFAGTLAPFTIGSLVVGQLGPFFALVPGGDEPMLQALADHAVTGFERFRAPLSDADILRRNPAALTPSEQAHLMAFGYPYVFSDFRFHMTLTGPIDEADRPAMRRLLDSHFGDHIGRPHRIGHIALFAEPERGRPFSLIAQAPLGVPLDRRFSA